MKNITLCISICGHSQGYQGYLGLFRVTQGSGRLWFAQISRRGQMICSKAYLVVISIILCILLLHHLSLTPLLLQSLTDQLSYLTLLPGTLPANHKPAQR